MTPAEEYDFQASRGTETDRLFVKRLTEGARVPDFGSRGAAGLDLYLDTTNMPEDQIILYSEQRMIMKTGISVAIPRGHYGRVAPRSGLAVKKGVDVLAGVIDEDYRGEIGVVLINFGLNPAEFNHGDKIAQLIIEKYTPCLPIEVDELVDTARGAGGFGSTGR